MPAHPIPSVTISKPTGCGSCHVTLMQDDSGNVTRVSAKLGRSGTCASSMVSAISKLASLAIKHGASVDAVAKKIDGITCSHPVPETGEDSGCSSCADAIARILVGLKEKE